jgi:hypothetical protein
MGQISPHNTEHKKVLGGGTLTDQDKPEKPRRHLKPVRESEGIPTQPESGTAGAINWSAMWMGLLISIGAIVFFAALGIGFNLSNSAGAKVLAPNTVWAGTSLILSMFIGGFVAVIRQSGLSLSRAFWHGLTLWGLTITAAVVLLLLGGSPVVSFLKADFLQQSKSAAGGIVALLSLLMLGAAISGALVGSLRLYRR